MHTVTGYINIWSASPDIVHKLQIFDQGAAHPCRAFSPKKSPFWRVRMYFSSLFGCFIVTFTWNTDHSLMTSSVSLSYDQGDNFTTHLSFADNEERVTTSTLSNDVITRPVECLKQQSIKAFIMPEGNINSQQGLTVHAGRSLPIQRGSVGYDVRSVWLKRMTGNFVSVRMIWSDVMTGFITIKEVEMTQCENWLQLQWLGGAWQKLYSPSQVGSTGTDYEVL